MDETSQLYHPRQPNAEPPPERWHRHLIGPGCTGAIAIMPLKADAVDYSLLTKAPPLVSAADQTASQDITATWLDMVSQTQAAQPHWT